MNRPIEEIKRDIESEKEKISVAQSNLVRLKKEFCEALSCEFAEDTGISEGDKFECVTTYKDNVGIEHTNKICGFLMGFSFDWLNTFSLVYREVGNDNTPSNVVRSIHICAECSYQFRKL